MTDQFLEFGEIVKSSNSENNIEDQGLKCVVQHLLLQQLLHIIKYESQKAFKSVLSIRVTPF